MNSLADLRSLSLRNQNNFIFRYLNINPISNKFDNLKLIIDEDGDILCVPETKINRSFPTTHFIWPAYHKPCRLDVSDRRGGLLRYIKSNKQYISENFSMIVDHYSSIYYNHIFLGDFNIELNSLILASFIQSLNLFDIIKSNTCFKGSFTSIDLILTNRKHCFKHFFTFETGLSDHHHLVYSMVKQNL